VGLTYGSLFSGIGGMDHGLDQAGWECVFQCELDSKCQDVLERHWPGLPRFPDVREISLDGLRERGIEPGSVDVLAGGFPCQDISLAGRREGLAGDRSGLFWEFHRVATLLRPRWLLIEDVPGLLSSGKRRDMGAVLRALVDSGYGVAYRVLDSQFFGLAQRRKRVFIVGHLGEPWSAPAEVLLERESRPWDPPPSERSRAQAPRGAGEGASGGVGTRPRDLEAYQCQGASVGPMGVLRSGNGGVTGGVPFIASGPVGTLQASGSGGRGHRLDAESAAGGHLVPVFSSRLTTHEVSPCLQERGGKGPDSDCTQAYVIHTSEPFTFDWQASGGNDTSWRGKSRQWIVRKPGLSGTLNACKTEAVFLTPLGVRRLTPLECERLQGYPDGWTELGASGKKIADSHRYRMCGNGVSSPVAEWIGHRIQAFHQDRKD